MSFCAVSRTVAPRTPKIERTPKRLDAGTVRSRRRHSSGCTHLPTVLVARAHEHHRRCCPGCEVLRGAVPISIWFCPDGDVAPRRSRTSSGVGRSGIGGRSQLLAIRARGGRPWMRHLRSGAGLALRPGRGGRPTRCHDLVKRPTRSRRSICHPGGSALLARVPENQHGLRCDGSFFSSLFRQVTLAGARSPPRRANRLGSTATSLS